MIENNMKTIRGKRAMLHSDLAKLYQVSPEHLHKQVSKNSDCFPETFLLKLTPKELSAFKGEAFPYAFTEQGILMAGGKLRSKQAVKIHVQFVRYFVQLFNQALNDANLSEELKELFQGESIFEVLQAMGKGKS